MKDDRLGQPNKTVKYNRTTRRKIIKDIGTAKLDEKERNTGFSGAEKKSGFI